MGFVINCRLTEKVNDNKRRSKKKMGKKEGKKVKVKKKKNIIMLFN